MSSLRNAIEALAASFASDVLTALRSASFEEIAGLSGSRRGPGRPPGRSARAGGTGGKRRRRSMKDIVAALDDVVRLVSGSSKGLRAEEIRDKLGLQSKELPRVLKEGLSTKRLSKKGEKRATTYFSGKGGSKKAGRRKKGASAASAPAAG
jgi:hypothetical protein